MLDYFLVDNGTCADYSNERASTLADTLEYVSSVFMTPIICALGISLNCLNLLVLLRRQSHAACSVHTYLIMLSVVDALYLIVIMPMGTFRCGSACGNRGLAATVYEHYVYLPLNNVLVCCDTWITVALASERLVFVRWPHRRPPLHARGTGLAAATSPGAMAPVVTVPIVVILSLALHAPYYLSTRVLSDGGTSKIEHDGLNTFAYGVARAILAKFLPLTALAAMNCALMCSLRQMHARRRSLVTPGGAATAGEGLRRRQARTTALLVAVVGLLVVGITPETIAYPPIAVRIFGSCLETPLYLGYRVVSNLAEQLAFSLNFFIYCTMNKHFTSELHEALCLLVKKREASGCCLHMPETVVHHVIVIAPSTPSPLASGDFGQGELN